jgi:hypothetical protein
MKNHVICFHLLVTALLITTTCHAANSAEDQEVLAKMQLCSAEGQFALHMARTYFTNGKKADQLVSGKSATEDNLQLVFELVNKVSTGEVKHYADFAAEKLYACAKRVDLSIIKPEYLARACYARVDIPHYLSLFKMTGSSKEAAVSKVTGMLKDRNIYPEPLIGAVANLVYQEPQQEPYEKLLDRIFWTCLYNDSISK